MTGSMIQWRTFEPLVLLGDIAVVVEALFDDSIWGC